MAKSRTKQSRFKLTRSRLILFGLILVLLAGGGWAFLGFKDNDSSLVGEGQDLAEDQTYVNLGPPTEQEKKETDAHKDDLARQQDSPPPNSNDKKQVTPVITSADKNQVRAFVPGIFEEGGTCKATATKGTSTVTGTSEGFRDSNYTNCGPINFTSPLSGSGWSVVVSYNSSTAEGKSDPYEVK